MYNLSSTNKFSMSEYYFCHQRRFQYPPYPIITPLSSTITYQSKHISFMVSYIILVQLINVCTYLCQYIRTFGLIVL